MQKMLDIVTLKWSGIFFGDSNDAKTNLFRAGFLTSRDQAVGKIFSSLFDEAVHGVERL